MDLRGTYADVAEGLLPMLLQVSTPPECAAGADWYPSLARAAGHAHGTLRRRMLNRFNRTAEGKAPMARAGAGRRGGRSCLLDQPAALIASQAASRFRQYSSEGPV